MAWLVTLLIVEILCGVHGAPGQADIERRMGSREPYDGFLNSFTARYRYPVYIRKRNNIDQGSGENSNDHTFISPYQDLSKKSFGNYDMSTLSRIMDSGKKRMALPLSELTPNMNSYNQMMKAGKRSPLDSLYDLPDAHRLFQVGKRSYHNLDLDTLKNILQAGKRNYHGLDLGSINKMMEVGKKSYGGMDLSAIDRLMQAGKRGYDSLDLHALDRLIQAGKRNDQGMDLHSINRLMQAGKRNYQGLDLEAINRLLHAGKRNRESDFSSHETPAKVGKRSFETVDLQNNLNEDDELKSGILLDIPFLEKIYGPEKRTNLLTRNIRPSIYDIKDMSKILEAGKKRSIEDNRTKRRVPANSKEITKNEQEENQTKDERQDETHERNKRSVEWEDIFGIDRKKRGIDWSTVFGIDRKKRSGDWSDVFGIDRKKRSWDDYFGYDKRNELQEELFDEWLANKYLENFDNNFILTKIDDDDEEERFGRAPPPGYGQL